MGVIFWFVWFDRPTSPDVSHDVTHLSAGLLEVERPRRQRLPSLREEVRVEGRVDLIAPHALLVGSFIVIGVREKITI